MIGLKVKALIGVGLAVALVAAGWQSRSWYEDSKDLSAENARQELMQAMRIEIASVGERVEQTLSEQVTKERVIDRGVIREIQKPIYQRVCFDPDLIRLLNLGAQGREADVSGELAEEVPGDTARTE